MKVGQRHKEKLILLPHAMPLAEGIEEPSLWPTQVTAETHKQWAAPWEPARGQSRLQRTSDNPKTRHKLLWNLGTTPSKAGQPKKPSAFPCSIKCSVFKTLQNILFQDTKFKIKFLRFFQKN